MIIVIVYLILNIYLNFHNYLIMLFFRWFIQIGIQTRSACCIWLMSINCLLSCSLSYFFPFVIYSWRNRVINSPPSFFFFFNNNRIVWCAKQIKFSSQPDLYLLKGIFILYWRFIRYKGAHINYWISQGKY